MKIPSNVLPVDIIGEKKSHLQRIEKSTNTHMLYNEEEAVTLFLLFVTRKITLYDNCLT